MEKIVANRCFGGQQLRYRHRSTVLDELSGLVGGNFPVDISRAGISGHSMGGHGALTIALRNPARFSSVSAFAPICSPPRCPWGEKALGAYLGPDRHSWHQYDATELLAGAKAGEQLPILVDQGEADEFLAGQLHTDLLQQASVAANYPVTIRMQPAYDHSYYFIATFIGEHLAFHARHL